MIVTLKTQNGTMSVNLKEFFPASRSRVKKLFLLMGQGLTVEDKRKVKAYLLELQAGVEKDYLGYCRNGCKECYKWNGYCRSHREGTPYKRFRRKYHS